MPLFGQVIVGPPGSGKTTYCNKLTELLSQLGRKVTIINLDPGNDLVPCDVHINICDLISVEDVMESKKLGPNGALVYCMQYLLENIKWLIDSIKPLDKHYLLFDFPGQAELYTHHEFTRELLAALDKEVRLCAVFLLDSHHANDPGKYISAAILALNSMLHLEIPTVNCLSKVDLLKQHGNLQFGLEFYTDVQDLSYLAECLNDAPVTKKYKKLNHVLAEAVNDYGLLSFIPFSSKDKSSLLKVMKAADKANGYIYGENEDRNIQRLLSCAVGAEWEHDRVGSVKDEYDDQDSDEEIFKLIANSNR